MPFMSCNQQIDEVDFRMLAKTASASWTLQGFSGWLAAYPLRLGMA